MTAAIARRIRSWSVTTEFAIVVSVAFGIFVVRSLYAAIVPPALPPLTPEHLRFLLRYESCVLAILGALLLVRGRKVDWESVRPTVQGTLMGFGLIVVSYAVVYLVWIVVNGLGYHPRYPGNYRSLVGGTMLVPLVVAASTLNAVYEESFLCGYVVTVLERRFGVATAVNVSVAIRLAYHLYQGAIGVLSVLPLGLIFTWWYARNRRLWPLLIAHAVMDVLALLW